ncbi:MAG: GNAT family N-acetyltransferase [Candidatus Hodarchaeales archaeon]|jgi:hypothetical protein
MNIIELGFEEFHKIRSLFNKTKHLSFTLDAVIAGNSPGRLWVDDSNEPSIAFLWDGSHCYYFVGITSNKEFNSAIKKLLFREIIPKVIENNNEIFKIEYYPKEWEPVVEEMLREKLPVKRARKFFSLNKLMIPKWKDILPSGFSVRKIQKTLLESEIKNVRPIIDEINECWYSVDNFLDKCFGFCLVFTPKNGEEEIQGWCTGEYFSEGKCGIGIEIFQGYKRRGFGSALSAAFVEYSMSVNIQPYWDAATYNDASIRVAQKVGFRKIQDYDVLFGTFKEL